MVLLKGRFTSSDYWFNQMYYGTHGPFKRAQAGQAITFENDKVSKQFGNIQLDMCDDQSWAGDNF